jgi:hypothetical protein
LRTRMGLKKVTGAALEPAQVFHRGAEVACGG